MSKFGSGQHERALWSIAGGHGEGEVTLTVDAGAEDAEVKRREKAEGLRRGRILRLTEEALEQGGVLTQEDLARVLGVTRRTIVQDMRALQAEDHLVHTRGAVKGVGRGKRTKCGLSSCGWIGRDMTR